HQIGFARIESLEPARTLFERSDSRDQRLDLNRATCQKLDGTRGLPGGRPGALEADLPGDNFFQWQRHFRRDIADQNHCASLADAFDRSFHSFVAADGFDRNINADARSELRNLFGKIIVRRQNGGGTQLLSELETRTV